MLEWLIEFWAETCFGLLIVGFLMMIIFVNMCYHELKKNYDEDQRAKLSKKDEKELKKMMPKLPKEEKNDNKR